MDTIPDQIHRIALAPDGYKRSWLANGDLPSDGGDPVSGFVAQNGFLISDNGDGTLSIVDAQQRFGTKPNGAKPVWYFDFGSGSSQPHPTLSRQQRVIPWIDACYPTTENAKPGATHSMIIDCETPDGSPSVTVTDKELPLPDNEGRKYYRYFDYYNAFTWTKLQGLTGSGPNYKTQRWQHATAQTGPYAVNTMQGSSYRFYFSEDAGGTYTSTMYNLTELNTLRWRQEEEYHTISSSAGAADAVMHGIMNGKRRFTRTNIDSHKGMDPNEYKWDYYKLGNFNKWAPTGECPWHANILYIDDSWCRIVITDNAAWDDSVEKEIEIQIPVGWAPEKVVFHKRGVATLAGKFLWVIDNDDNKILIGGWV